MPPDSCSAQRGIGFVADILPLFRPFDLDEMWYLFDLASVDDVREYAEAILERLQDGSMPCDAPWPPEHVETFRQWIAQGMPD